MGFWVLGFGLWVWVFGGLVPFHPPRPLKEGEYPIGVSSDGLPFIWRSAFGVFKVVPVIWDPI